MWRAHPDNNTPEAWRDLVESMKQALAVAEEYGVVLALEPEVANVIDSAQKARRLLDEMQSPLSESLYGRREHLSQRGTPENA